MSADRRATVRVIVADDAPLQRSGWARVLGSQPGIEVVAEANDGVHLLSLLRRTPCDVVVADVQMPRLTGVDVVERMGLDQRVLEEQGALPAVLLMTAVDRALLLPVALRAGAVDLLYKDVAPEELIGAVRGAATARAGD